MRNTVHRSALQSPVSVPASVPRSGPVIGLVLAVCALLCARAAHAETRPGYGGTVKSGLLGEPATIDPVDPVLIAADVDRASAYEGGSPMSPRASELFSVNGNLVKPLPPEYHHDLVSEYRPMPTEEQWEALRFCESSGDYAVTNFSGKYRGAYQFDLETWETVGGTGDPAAASPAEQDHRALRLYLSRGHAPWPECGRFLPQD